MLERKLGRLCVTYGPVTRPLHLNVSKDSNGADINDIIHIPSRATASCRAFCWHVQCHASIDYASISTYGSKERVRPLSCTYLVAAVVVVVVVVVGGGGCSSISTHPLRDLHERGQSMKPTRGAVSALRHIVLAVRQGEKERISLTRHVVLLLLLLLLCLPKSQHTRNSTSPRPHSVN